MLSGLAAFVYVAALWYIAPAFLRDGAGVADRLRVLLALGIAIPGALGLLHLLYSALVWVSVLVLAVWRVRKRPPAVGCEAALYVALADVVIVVWAPLVRPLLDGDTLLYHLPNAAAFVQAHSVWIAGAPYWLYPPASELFAAGIFAVSGRWSLPLAGIVPALLLAARLYTVARANGASVYAAAGVPLAFICMPVAAFQAGTLQNDLWLAAFFVEVLDGGDRSPLSLAVCALLKPYGWLEALIASAAARVPWRIIVLALLPLLLWIVRDAVLLRGGATTGFSTPAYFPTTIAGNFGIAAVQLAHGIAAVTPQAFVWIAMLAAGFVFRTTRRYAAAGTAALAVYVFLPVSYTSGATNYVTDASSLRYALPALAAGALIAAALLERSAIWGALAAYLIAAWGAWNVLAVFWNDSYTHWAFAAAAFAACAALLVQRTRGVSIAAAALVLVLIGSWGASTRARGFYGDWMRAPSGKPTGVFSWISAHKPQRVLAANVRTGAVLMSSAQTRTTSAASSDPCGQARHDRALLLVGSNEGMQGAQLEQTLAAARACGTILYQDGAAVLVQPP
ncbi:MAG TPA: hypothetical protein VFN37_00625 [Candidatus Baltobacteraceae bacterium]|nr:hypothetical protein [Candidatus Baltobacteraceae bacterium]